MTAVGMQLRAGFRLRWRSWLALALLVGTFGGLVTATAAGARRTDGAFPRLLAWSNAPDAETYWVTGALVGRVEAAALARLPQVRATASTVGWTVLNPAADELTIGHLLSTSVRRRGRDLAILATIGFTRRQVRATVAWQAATLAVVALLIGIPAGIICGRLAWLVFTRQLGIVPVVDVPLLTLTALAAAATVLALAAAVPLGQTAARSRPARVLRSE